MLLILCAFSSQVLPIFTRLGAILSLLLFASTEWRRVCEVIELFEFEFIEPLEVIELFEFEFIEPGIIQPSSAGND